MKEEFIAYLGQELGILDTAKEEGRAEGRAEGKAEVAKNLLDLGMEISTVAKATGMTEEEVKRLKA